MRSRKTTKTSVVFMTDDPIYREAIKETVHTLATYESSVVEVSTAIVAEIFLGQNLPPVERACYVREIFEVFDSVLERLEEE